MVVGVHGILVGLHKHTIIMIHPHTYHIPTHSCTYIHIPKHRGIDLHIPTNTHNNTISYRHILTHTHNTYTYMQWLGLAHSDLGVSSLQKNLSLWQDTCTYMHIHIYTYTYMHIYAHTSWCIIQATGMWIM
jgi:hypothetical protein